MRSYTKAVMVPFTCHKLQNPHLPLVHFLRVTKSKTNICHVWTVCSWQRAVQNLLIMLVWGDFYHVVIHEGRHVTLRLLQTPKPTLAPCAFSTCHEVQSQYLPCVGFLLLATRRAKFVDNAGLRRLLPRGYARRPPYCPWFVTNSKTHTCLLCIFRMSQSPKPLRPIIAMCELFALGNATCKICW